MTSPIDLLKRQIELNRCAMVEIAVHNTTLKAEIEENDETVKLLEAANAELDVAISKLKENV